MIGFIHSTLPRPSAVLLDNAQAEPPAVYSDPQRFVLNGTALLEKPSGSHNSIAVTSENCQKRVQAMSRQLGAQ